MQTIFKYDNHRIPPDCEYITSLMILNYQQITNKIFTSNIKLDERELDKTVDKINCVQVLCKQNYHYNVWCKIKECWSIYVLHTKIRPNHIGLNMMGRAPVGA